VRDAARRLNHCADKTDRDDLPSGQLRQVRRSDTHSAVGVAGDESASLCPALAHQITGVQQQRA
jgi:hypothetical protein